ncbi:MAG: hypothetical protein JWO03_3075 [Bacteroidetes bacterium]|nr:hypothetical protein [Bacteroidota bacterium]
MDFLHDPFGLQTEHMDTWQMLLRGLVVFFAALGMIRIAGLRTLGKQSAFDQLTILIIGSILGRAVVTGKNFFGNLAAVLLIVLIQRLLAWITYRSKAMGKIFKGSPLPLIHYGQKQRDNMKKALVTDEDLKEALHLNLNADKTETINEAYLERSGQISFIKTKEKDN